jgi:hypothetical protein
MKACQFTSPAPAGTSAPRPAGGVSLIGLRKRPFTLCSRSEACFLAIGRVCPAPPLISLSAGHGEQNAATGIVLLPASLNRVLKEVCFQKKRRKLTFDNQRLATTMVDAK